MCRVCCFTFHMWLMSSSPSLHISLSLPPSPSLHSLHLSSLPLSPARPSLYPGQRWSNPVHQESLQSGASCSHGTQTHTKVSRSLMTCDGIHTNCEIMYMYMYCKWCINLFSPCACVHTSTCMLYTVHDYIHMYMYVFVTLIRNTN